MFEFFNIYLFIYQSISCIDVCLLPLLGVLITSLIIRLVLSFSLSSGVTWQFHEKYMLCASLSSLMSPLSSLLTFVVLSLLLILKLHGLQIHFIPLGLISIVFCNCSFPWHKGQSKLMNLLWSFCSSSSVIIVGSSSDSS